MLETYSILKSIIFELNKEKCIKRIVNKLFENVIFNLEKLSNYNAKKLFDEIRIGKKSVSSTDACYLNEENVQLEDYISIILNGIKCLISIRNAVEKEKSRSNRTARKLL
jgi:hypothetical protein